MSEGHDGDTRPAVRATARILVLDPRRRVLLFRTHWDRRLLPPRWITPGGGIDAGEGPHEAAVRELFEETGQRVDGLGTPVFHQVFALPRAAKAKSSDATYFLWRTAPFEPVADHWTPSERDDVLEWRWWSLDDLRATDEPLDPERVVRVLDAVLAPAP